MLGTAGTGTREARVYVLVSSPDAPGGIARTTATLANELADRYTVEVIGMRRLTRGRAYPLDPRVTVRYVVDEPAGVPGWIDSLPSRHGRTRRQGQSALVDLLLPRVLRRLEPGVVLSTRPFLHVAALRYVPSHCTVVGHDHVNIEFRRTNRSLRSVAKAIDGMARFVVLTEADAVAYRRAFPQAAGRVQVIRNPAPWTPDQTSPHQPAAERQPVIVAAGQLGRRKGFDRLLDAFQPIAAHRPDWQVHIYGEGPRRAFLEQQIAERGLRGRVLLKGRTPDMRAVLRQASIFALTSRNEGLPMVLIEATTAGVPVVSFDCPHGPAEIVVDGVTGRLVPNGDVPAFTDALRSLIDDPECRTRMSRQAIIHAARFRVEPVIGEWTQLIDGVHP